MSHIRQCDRYKELECLWRQLTDRLSNWRPDWRVLAGPPKLGTASAGTFRHGTLSNQVIFEAFAVALLSGNTRWDRIERIRDDLAQAFAGFDLLRYSLIPDREIDQILVPWFREHRAGSPALRTGLCRLRATAHRLSSYPGGKTSAHAFLLDAGSASDGSPEDLAVVLARSPEWKLPGFGIALAAEALRILGLDLCKPDRHILRALGSWSLIEFAHWNERGAFTPPRANPSELRRTMFEVRAIAEANDVSVSYANSVIWMAGAVSGAHLTNAEFREIGTVCIPRASIVG